MENFKIDEENRLHIMPKKEMRESELLRSESLNFI